MIDPKSIVAEIRNLKITLKNVSAGASEGENVVEGEKNNNGETCGCCA